MADEEPKPLTQEAIEQCKEAFHLCDSDGAGMIAPAAIARVFRMCGMNPTEAELGEMLTEVDGDAVDFEQVVGFVQRNQKERDMDEDFKDAFRVFDKDGNGFTSASELRHIMTHLGEKMADEDISEMFDLIEIDGDGQINYEEYVKVLLAK